MPTMLSLRDANQRFSRCVREVEAGEEFVITRNGTPVARLVPIAPASGRKVLTPEQEAARARTLARGAVGWPLGGERFSREAMYNERLDELERRREAAQRGDTGR